MALLISNAIKETVLSNHSHLAIILGFPDFLVLCISSSDAPSPKHCQRVKCHSQKEAYYLPAPPASLWVTHHPRLHAQLFSFRASQSEAEELQREPKAPLAWTPRLRGSKIQATHWVCVPAVPAPPPSDRARCRSGKRPCAALPAASARARHVLPALARESERHRRGPRSRSACCRRYRRRRHWRSSCGRGRHASAGSPRGAAGWGRWARGAHLVSTAPFSFFQPESHRGCRIAPEPLPQHGDREHSGEGRELGRKGPRRAGGGQVENWWSRGCYEVLQV